MLVNSQEKYGEIIDIFPDIIIIVVDESIVLANKVALKYDKDIVGKGIYEYSPNYVETIKKRKNQILKNKIKRTVFDYKVVLKDGKNLDLEVLSSYIIYNGKPAILSIMRDITELKRDLNLAAKIQKDILHKPFPLLDKADMETIYTPAKTVSGDFFYVHKVNEEYIVGILGDVSGKGITAALNISAFNVLFHEAVLNNKDPYNIIKRLNKKVATYMGERYVAACCFSLDFKNNEAKIVGAGINEFMYKKNKCKVENKIVLGPFLGMFENSEFDVQTIQYSTGDEFYFFTDGLDFVLENEKVRKLYFDNNTISESKKKLKNTLNKMLTDVDGVSDDCTVLAFRIK